MKRFLIIVGVIIIVVGICFLLYLFTRQGAANPAPGGQTGTLPSAPNQNPGTNTSSTPGSSVNSPSASSSATFGIVSNDPALEYYVDGQNNTTIIEPGGIVEIITNGQATVISSSSIQNIIGAGFSYDGKKLLVNFGDATKPQTNVFDVATKSWTSLPQGMQSPVWSFSNYQIAYLVNTGNGMESVLELNVASTKAQPTTTLLTMAAEDLSLTWVNNGTLLLFDKPSAYTLGSAWLFSVANRTLTSAVFEYPGMQSIWSNTTSTLGLVFSGSSGNQGGQVSFMNPAGSRQQAITFTTLPSKCVFHGDSLMAIQTASSTPGSASGTPQSAKQATPAPTSTSVLDLYCAVPRDQQTLAIARLPDEYNQKILFTSDDFYKVSTVDGTLMTIFKDPNQNLDATRLKIFNNTLFFINRYDQKLYAIALQHS